MNKPITTQAARPQAYPCQVVAIQPLSADTFAVELHSKANTALAYHAGQYLQLELDINSDGRRQPLFYSIANRLDASQPQRLQLFIQSAGESSAKVIKHLAAINEQKASIDVTLPMGSAFLQTDLQAAHILIAAGSGISKIKSITEEILARKPDAQVSVYWSNKQVGDFYLLEQFQNWAQQHQNLRFTPILETENDHWQGRTGYIYQVIQQDFECLHDIQCYLCGSPRMVYGTIDTLKPFGLAEENCYSDVFEYAPR